MSNTLEKCFQWLSNTETTSWESIGHFDKMWGKAWCPTMVQRQFAIIHRQGSLACNSPDRNRLDYSIWNEFAHAINWNKVTLKNTLIIEWLERFVNKLSLLVVHLEHNWLSSHISKCWKLFSIIKITYFVKLRIGNSLFRWKMNEILSKYKR